MAQANEVDGVRVVMSPVQLSAVLSRRSVNRTEMLTNLLWGGLQIVGGMVEMVGASALCVMPEPTMASKAGCIVFGVHGSDTVAAGLHQVWTGQNTATLTQQGTTALAQAAKASPDIANNIGLSIDVGVSFGVAGMVKAARVSRVAMGRINLMRHEAEILGGPGGHTILKHVGRTDAQLMARLAAEPQRKFVSTFTNLETAEWAISEVMRANATRITAWAQSRPKGTLPLAKDVGKTVGRVLSRETGKITDGSKVVVVMKCEEYNGLPYYVLTAFLG